jgi:tRNA nucleotidyltransferase/poly(A) polymerase
MRRDLTQNALFYDIDKEEVIDLVGGMQDIETNVISAVGEASERFIEDRLRICRVFRFASRHQSKIGQSTIDAIKKDKRLRNISKIDDVSQERIVEEFEKAVKWASDNKSFPALNYYLELLDEYEMFDEMFPDLDIDIDNINTFNLSVIFALLFRNNDIEKLRNKLKNYRFSNAIADKACFLLRFKKYIKDINKIPDLYTEKNRYHVDNQTILEFADLYDLNDNYLKAFLKFEPVIDSDELMEKGFKHAKLGAEIKRLKIEQFKKLL